jgi:hypothetical protein
VYLIKKVPQFFSVWLPTFVLSLEPNALDPVQKRERKGSKTGTGASPCGNAPVLDLSAKRKAASKYPLRGLFLGFFLL